MFIVSTRTHVSVSVNHGIMFRISTASADQIRPGIWWISRVKVADSFQGKGLGTQLLTTLLAECMKQGAKAVEVTPGGYGADPERQKAFYARAGFKGEGLMRWVRTP